MNLYHEGYKLGLANMAKRSQGEDFDVFECPYWSEEEFIEGYSSGCEDYLNIYGIWEGRIRHAKL